jgi:hypothetical protein
MGFPEENDPESKVERRPLPTGKVLPFAPRRRPEWLTGPNDDVRAASGSAETPSAETPSEERGSKVLAEPVLTRPAPPVAGQLDGPGDARRSAEAVEPDLGPGEDAPPAASSQVAWTAAASSIPVLKTALPTEPEEPEARLLGPPSERGGGLPGGNEDRQLAAAPPTLKPLHEPWWLIALDALRTERRVQLAVAGALAGAVLLACWMWPHGVDSTPLSRVRRNPSQYDGRSVLVRGRVGDDVFAVGGGWAFYLVQGRDTIVAFSRTRAPKPREVVSVKGQVSTGFLDGSPRQALFEDAAAAK